MCWTLTLLWWFRLGLELEHWWLVVVLVCELFSKCDSEARVFSPSSVYFFYWAALQGRTHKSQDESAPTPPSQIQPFPQRSSCSSSSSSSPMPSPEILHAWSVMCSSASCLLCSQQEKVSLGRFYRVKQQVDVIFLCLFYLQGRTRWVEFTVSRQFKLWDFFTLCHLLFLVTNVVPVVAKNIKKFVVSKNSLCCRSNIH